jgi:hypothetical protein
MVKGKAMTPTPEGQITSTETWVPAPEETVEEVVEEVSSEEELDQA